MKGVVLGELLTRAVVEDREDDVLAIGPMFLGA